MVGGPGRGPVRSWSMPEDACRVAVDANMPDPGKLGELNDLSMGVPTILHMADHQIDLKKEGTKNCFFFSTPGFQNYEIDYLF
jgi:hypothetical protein